MGIINQNIGENDQLMSKKDLKFWEEACDSSCLIGLTHKTQIFWEVA